MIDLGVLINSPNPGYITCIKPYNHVILSNQKHVSTLKSYRAIINGIFAKLNKKKKTTNPDEIKIKDELVLQGMTQVAADEIE